MNILNTLIYIVAAYLIGSISFALVSSKIFRTADPRTYGSKNPGATNMLRSGNKKAAFLTLIGDALKGWVVVWFGVQFGAEWGIDGIGIASAGLAVFIGHLWPVFLKFKGGKGVATALGVLTGFIPLLGLMVFVTWLIIVFISRYSSLAAIISAILAPLYCGLLSGFSLPMAAVTVISILLISRHSQNIGKLISGKESRIGSKKG